MFFFACFSFSLFSLLNENKKFQDMLQFYTFFLRYDFFVYLSLPGKPFFQSRQRKYKKKLCCCLHLFSIYQNLFFQGDAHKSRHLIIVCGFITFQAFFLFENSPRIPIETNKRLTLFMNHPLSQDGCVHSSLFFLHLL